MSDAHQDILPTEVLARPEALLRVPVGLSSPLWGLFAGAAMTGSAWWWMTRWTQIENLEALFGAAEARAVKAATLPIPAVEAAVEAAIESVTALEEVIEPAAQAAAAVVTGPLAEVLHEAPPAEVLEAMEASADVFEAVGGESAPISPVVAAMAPAPETPDEAAAPIAAEEEEAPVRPRRRPKAD